MAAVTEFAVEEATLFWLRALGYLVLYGPDFVADEPGTERSDSNYRDLAFLHGESEG